MAHFAEVDADNTVLRVIVADTKEWCENNLGGTWVQTSYNTIGGVHPEGRPLHKNYAGDRKSTRLNSSHSQQSRMPSSA